MGALHPGLASRDQNRREDRLRAGDAKLFIDLVLEAAAKSPCTLVLSARSDFYPDIQNHFGLRSAAQESQVSLGTMNEAELRDVIEGRPRALGASVDPELRKRLIRDIGLEWLILIFGGFGCRARNAVIVVSLVLAAALISATLFLIVDLDTPFSGPMRISLAPLERACAEMQR